ncbi:hypothetical protein ACFSFZ_05400 [Mixta tenebrionis]|uniref:Uncharacterized protein n=1 Tax=Mixta tenebrionis TaxID=2562439 RepID=A0A506V6A1_9GAMM|nr:hypothetical protein [Mixta tenebrionis]TPW41235.1 hypothetical protein FKM52_15385 [Mixta tenebrionis]
MRQYIYNVQCGDIRLSLSISKEHWLQAKEILVNKALKITVDNEVIYLGEPSSVEVIEGDFMINFIYNSSVLKMRLKEKMQKKDILKRYCIDWYDI